MTETWIQEYLDDAERREERAEARRIKEEVARKVGDHLSKLIGTVWDRHMRQSIERYTRMYASATLRRLQIATRVLERPYARFCGKHWEGEVEAVEVVVPTFTVHISVPRP